MNYKKSIALAACLVSVGVLTGCSSSSNSSSNNNGNNNNTNPPPPSLAATSLAGKTLNVSVSSGAAPFSSSGSYAFLPAGSGTSGTYQLNGAGGVQSNTGTYTYSKTGDNTGNLVETEDINGTIVNNTLTFQTTSSGTIQSTSPNKGGVQSGTFTLN